MRRVRFALQFVAYVACAGIALAALWHESAPLLVVALFVGIVGELVRP